MTSQSMLDSGDRDLAAVGHRLPTAVTGGNGGNTYTPDGRESSASEPAEVLTADQAWSKLDPPVVVTLIR